MADLEEIRAGETLIALILRASFHKAGINFLTGPESSLQLGQMTRPRGDVVIPHQHKPIRREVVGTMEAVLLRRGRVRADLYDSDRQLVAQRELGEGDLILLAGGGHGFTMLAESDLVEVKQGPYAGQDDKERF